MKAVGIIRRIDNLGRVAIPKEIQRSLYIKDEASFEIYVSDDCICLKPYFPINDIQKRVEELETIVKESYDLKYQSALYGFLKDFKTKLLEEIEE